MGKIKKSNKAVSRKRLQPNPRNKPVTLRLTRPGDWPHPLPSPVVAWTKLERRGGAIVLGGSSMSTASGMQADYHTLYWAARQLGQWASQKKENGEQPKLDDAKKDFAGTILVGDKHTIPYVTDGELKRQINHPQSPSSFAEEIVTRRWGFTDATSKTYLHRKPHAKSAKD